MRRLRAVLFCGAVGLAAATPGASVTRAEPGEVRVAVRPIAAFKPGSGETRFGQLEFTGGLVLHPSSSRVGGLSALRLSQGRSHLLAITDNGDWFSATIERDAAGRLAGLSNAKIAPLLNEAGHPLDSKVEADAESLAIDGDEVLVGFERDHRILSYSPASDPMESRAKRVALPFPRKVLQTNRGLETIAVSPKASPLAGAAVAIAEHSLDKDGNHRAAIFRGARNGPFTIERKEPFDVTDGAFLPNGDLLILERSYSTFRGVAMQIRRLPGSQIKPGAVLDGPVLIQANMAAEIDNMEGLDVSVGADGATYLTLISDDNDNFLQRSLLLEFRLSEGETATATGAAPSN